ncbi:MAG: hypothetical protein ABIP94_23420 [Planctomycetota bacterium]
MNMHRSVLIAAALFSAGLSAQDPNLSQALPVPGPAPAALPQLGPAAAEPKADAVVMQPLCTPIHSAESDLGQSYGLWAAGDTYKVAFDSGATFVPYLGREYPHNQPFRWQTTSIRVGAEELTLR